MTELTGTRPRGIVVKSFKSRSSEADRLQDCPGVWLAPKLPIKLAIFLTWALNSTGFLGSVH